jgi:non-ribosomal peptide synthetase component E (peptide arylation enzyme)
LKPKADLYLLSGTHDLEIQLEEFLKKLAGFKDDIAIIDGKSSLSYADLSSRAKRFVK